MAGYGRKAENKAKDQHRTDIIPSKLIAELQHSARLGKTFPGGWLAGWLGGVKLEKRLISSNWELGVAELGNTLAVKVF